MAKQIEEQRRNFITWANIEYDVMATVIWDVDDNFGADADGNRGVTRYTISDFEDIEMVDMETGKEVYDDLPLHCQVKIMEKFAEFIEEPENKGGE